MTSAATPHDDTVAPLSQSASWLARAAANNAAYWEHPARAMGHRWAHWDDAWAVDAQCPTVVYNAATLLRPLDAGQAEATIDRIRQFYAAQPGPAWFLFSAWPSPDLAMLGCRFVAHMPAMVRLPDADLPPPPAELRIVEATDAAVVAAYERVMIDGYPCPELQPARRGTLHDARVVGGRLRIWVGYVGDRPVATASTLADDAVTGVYAVATLPEARRRGYGTALTAHAVASSPSLPAVLGASDSGYAIYARLGFRDVGRYDLWLSPR